ncbi:MAG: hypothetical protein IH949_10870 [Bacteroidetes bacterium]|nr:hypothetical protein [Bacteroidota bacterium]
MAKMKCLFCKRDLETYPIANSSCTLYDCPSCGRFGLTEDLLVDIAMINDENMKKISHLLIEYKLRKQNPLLLAMGTDGAVGNFIWSSYLNFLANYPKEPIEIIDRTLMNLARLIAHPSQKIRITEDVKELFFSRDTGGIFYIIRQLANQGFISLITSMPNDITIEAQGWKRINELKKKPEGLNNQAFVAMWFDKSTNDIYLYGIKKAIEDTTQYQAMRVDFVHHNNKICDQIIAEINKSKFMVADFTGDRGGVYFEAGYAQGIKIPVIWIVKDDWVDKLHFDTRQYNHIVYNDEKELYSKLKARIEATIINSV